MNNGIQINKMVLQSKLSDTAETKRGEHDENLNNRMKCFVRINGKKKKINITPRADNLILRI